MFRIRIASMFLASLTMIAGGAAFAQEEPAGEAGGQTYGGTTYDKAGEPEKATPAPSETEKEMEPEQKTEMEVPAPAAVQVEPVAEEEEWKPILTPFGMSFAVGGGVAGFTDDTMRDITDLGGAWDARLAIGTQFPIALEAAYIGTAQEISALGLDPDATLVSNGVEGALRLNLGTYMVQPFLFAGAGWQRYNVVGEDFNTSSVADEDDIFQLPVGAGVAFKTHGFLIDGRVTYRETWGNDLMTQPSADSSDGQVELNQWQGSARIGFEF